MDFSDHLWTSLLIVLLFINENAFGLRCYVCQSDYNAACGDVFTLMSDSDDVTGFCRTSCFKFVAARDDNRVISRGCMPSNRIIPNCRSDRDGDIYGTFCACNEDFCNHVTSVHKFSSRMSFTVFFILFNIVMN